MAPRDIEEADFMKIGFFKNLWFIALAVGFVIFILMGVILMGIVYLTSGIRFDPTNFGMPSLYDQDPNE